jgi:hypothetical protein
MTENDKQKLIQQTSYLPTSCTLKYRQWILAGNEPKKCPVCGSYILPKSMYCSKKCSANSPTTVINRRQTYVDKYGYSGGTLPDKILENRRRCAEERYGQV